MAKRNPKNSPEEIEFTLGSGNVYADFGFPNPEEAKAKAELAMLISGIIKEKGLTQQQAAECADQRSSTSHDVHSWGLSQCALRLLSVTALH